MFFSNSMMLKKIILLAVLFFHLTNLNAQGWNNVRLGLDIGVLDLLESENFGLFLNVEPKLKSSRNMTLGLRIAITANSLTYENYDNTQFSINEASGNGSISFVPTLDYCWYENKFRPNLGFGIGTYLLVTYLDVYPITPGNSYEEVIEINVKNRFGLLLKGGFTLGRSRLGLEYNFVPKAELEIPTGQKVGKVDLSYFGLSIGLILGDKRGPE